MRTSVSGAGCPFSTVSRWRLARSRYRTTPEVATRASIPDATRSRPDQFLECHHRLQAGQAGLPHVDETALADRRAPAGGIDEMQRTDQEAAPHVELDALLQDGRRGRHQPIAVLDRHAEVEPVREVDEGSGSRGDATDFVAQAVVAPGRVGDRVCTPSATVSGRAPRVANRPLPRVPSVSRRPWSPGSKPSHTTVHASGAV